MKAVKKTPVKRRVGDGTPGPGRPKGVPNKLTKSVRDAFKYAFDRMQKSPKVRLTVWGKNNPTEFYKIASKLIPQDLSITGRLTLEELVKQASKKDDNGG